MNGFEKGTKVLQTLTRAGTLDPPSEPGRQKNTGDTIMCI